jgi:ABC-type sugar transport system ATPase subunit
MENLLRVENLTKRFGGLTAVDKVSLEVNVGEVVGLLGDNGAGKSTLIKMVSGVYQPDDGEIYFNGNKVDYTSPADARDLGIETIYQDLALAENMNIGSNIFLGREILRSHLGGLIKTVNHDKMREEAEKALDRLNIHLPSLTQQVLNLSGGQRQAVAIARSIYWNAKLMIMDEPTAALGVSEQRKVLRLVKTLCDQGVPVIIISHNMHDVFAVATRLVVMRRGKKVGERFINETSPDEIVSLMVGAEEVQGAGMALDLSDTD